MGNRGLCGKTKFPSTQLKAYSMKPNGYVIHEDSSRVCIATGFNSESNNRKTGPMIQIWILVKNETPVDAVKSGSDRLICGNCPHRGAKGKNRSCYVNVCQAPQAIWKAWQRGAYPAMPSVDVFRGHKVRFGAYGDPTWIPLGLALSIAQACDGHTGYTHQWRKPSLAGWSKIVMASVDSTLDLLEARSRGWGTFRVSKDLDHHKFETLCLSESRGTACADCTLCNGRKKSVFIPAHGSGAVHFVSRN